MIMNELGVLKELNEDDDIKFYHVHRIKSCDDQSWNIGEKFDTDSFLRPTSYDFCKQLRENAFEEVRTSLFSDFPTRRKCLFFQKYLIMLRRGMIVSVVKDKY